MRIFFTLLRNEIFKCINAPFSWFLICILSIPAIVVFVFLWLMPFEEFIQRVNTTNGDLDPYNYLFKWFKILFGFILIPYYAVFLVWLFDIERKAKGWKFLCTLPINHSKILLAKIFTATGFIFISLVISCGTLFVSIAYLNELKTDWQFHNYPELEIEILLIIYTSIFVNSLPALLMLLIIVLIFDSPGSIIITAFAAAVVAIPYNPFHFHMLALELYPSLRAGGYPNFSFYQIPIAYSIIIAVGIMRYSDKVIKLL